VALPSPALSAPSLLGDQIKFQGLTLGNPPNTPFGLTQLENLDKPDVRSGNQDRAQQRGAFIGANQLKTRTFTTTLDIGPPFGSYTNLAGAIAAFRAMTSTEGAVEYPLWVQIPGFPLVCTLARVLKSNVKWDITADLGHLVQGATVQFESTDPYLYSAPTVATTIALPTPGGGFSFPLTFPFSFGGGTTPNQATIVNHGNVPCWPTLVIAGPCLNPTVGNPSIMGTPTVSLNIQLNTGDLLYVDCDLGSVVFYPSGGTSGTPLPNIVNPGSEFFSIPPGSSLVTFNSADVAPVAGTCTVWSASAYSGLLG
jgi:hypothetical protein